MATRQIDDDYPHDGFGIHKMVVTQYSCEIFVYWKSFLESKSNQVLHNIKLLSRNLQTTRLYVVP